MCLILPSHSVGVRHSCLPGAILGPSAVRQSRPCYHGARIILYLQVYHIFLCFLSVGCGVGGAGTGTSRPGHPKGDLNSFISLICFASSLCPLNMLRFPLAYLDVYTEGFVSSFGWIVASLFQRRGLRSERPDITGPWNHQCREIHGSAQLHGWPWGHKSVHRSAKTVLQSNSVAFVYTVLPLQTDVKAKECTQIDEDGLSVPFRGIRVRCYNASYSVNCDASCDVNCG